MSVAPGVSVLPGVIVPPSVSVTPGVRKAPGGRVAWGVPVGVAVGRGVGVGVGVGVGGAHHKPLAVQNSSTPRRISAPKMALIEMATIAANARTRINSSQGSFFITLIIFTLPHEVG